MLYYTNVCKQNKQEKKGFVSSKDHRFVMPISEQKTWTVTGVFRKDV